MNPTPNLPQHDETIDVEVIVEDDDRSSRRYHYQSTDHSPYQRKTFRPSWRFEGWIFLLLLLVALIQKSTFQLALIQAATWLFWFAITWRVILALGLMLIGGAIVKMASRFLGGAFFPSLMGTAFFALVTTLLPAPLGLALIAFSHEEPLFLLAGALVLLYTWGQGFFKPRP